MTAPETLHARQAALLLHGLPLATRQEVMAKLDAVEAARLEPLLAELDALGVPATLGHSLQRIESPTPQERAAHLHGDHVVACLQDCSAITVARLLAAADWPWKQHVLARMNGLRRLEVQRHLLQASAQLAPAVLAVWCERLCSCAPPARVRAADSRTFSGLFGRLLRWMQ